ncbi:MAG: DNA-directed RNA polymerase subunit beta', partial [Planctomycetota bacterium]|nr:DNA-directed RNA polymerase subunit beta' [Planctomycetota bacterium]
HLPLSFEAQVEATTLMLSTNNVFSPANGQPIIAPSQDIVLGCYYMTCGNTMELGEDLERPYDSFQEVEMAWRQNKVTLQTHIKIRLPERTRVMEIVEGDRVFLSAKNSKIIHTSVGRCIFHDIIPKGMPFYNYPLKKGRLMEIIADSHKYVGRKATLELLDDLKDTGFKHSTLAGLSFATHDLHIPKRKVEIIAETQNKVGQIQRQYEKGVITNLERYNQIIDEWTHATERVGEEMIVGLKNDIRDGKPFLNPVYLMAISGARGSHQQIRQLAGMRGLMAKPSGKIIETPIKANFREGLHVLEYFSSTHGARKGLADTALKTADSGYLTRKLADIGQNVVINEKDCGTERGISKGAVFAGEMVEVPFWRSIRGRTARDTIVDVVTDEVIVSENELITEDIARKIEKTLSKKGKIRVRSSLTCDTPIGICATCYGMDLSRGRIVEEGLAVGIIAAQSIGEPGTQLTMRTFHIGGVSTTKRQESDIFAGITGKIMYENMRVHTVHGEQIEIEGKGTIHICDDRGITLESYEVPLGSIIHVKEDAPVKMGVGKKKGSLLFQWDPHMEPILALKGGKASYEGIIEGVTMRREKDSKTQVEYQVIIEHKGDHHPMIVVNDEEGQTISSYPIPEGAHLEVDPGESIVPGQLLAKTPREVGGTQDITGGLPRVTEIFEVRKPRTPAVMAEIDGQVEIGPKKRGKGTILIRSAGGQLVEHTFQHGRKLHVHTGDTVKAGDALTKGNMIPHDILRICGAEALQQYLLQEVQKVYRSQNVIIDDKHIEIVIMQMIRKVQVADTGDTEFLPGQIIDKFQFRSHNKSIANRGGKPATADPLLLGITKASLFSESFISAASFQETTKVLTEAALSGKEDRLLGLKENVILGHLVPAGTGFKGYHSCVVEKFATEPGPDPLGESIPMSLGGGKLD